MAKKVRAGAVYTYRPVLMDRIDPPYGAMAGTLHAGDQVQVVNLPGCPRANTMGMCHIHSLVGDQFLGLVCTNSLLTPAEEAELAAEAPA